MTPSGTPSKLHVNSLMDFLESTPGPPLLAHSRSNLTQFWPVNKNSLRAAQSSISSARPHIVDLPVTVAKHVGKFYGKTEMEFPTWKLYKIIISTSGSTLDIGHFNHTTGQQIAHSLTAPFLIQSDSRLSRWLALSTVAHFHIERQIALWAQARQGHSVLWEVPGT